MAPKRNCCEMEDHNEAGNSGPPLKRMQPTEAEIAFVVKAKIALLGLAVHREALRHLFGDYHPEISVVDIKMEEIRSTLRERRILGCDFTERQENYIRATAQRRAGR